MRFRNRPALLAGAFAVLAGIAAVFMFSRSKGQSDQPGFAAAELERPFLAAADVVAPLQKARHELDAVVAGGSEKRPSEIADRLEMTFEALKRAAGQIPRDTFDPDAILASIGREPSNLVAWVRAETMLVPYQGVLRGPVGVLLDRTGNSLDRSLLLFELLRRSGHTVRLARATLTEAEAASLLQSVRARGTRPPRRSVDPTSQIVDDFLQSYAKRFGGDTGTLRGRVQAVRDAAKAVGVEAARRAEVQGATLLQLATDKLRSTAAPMRQRHLQALADHWWVQQQQDDGWIDLDPTNVAVKGNPAPASTMQPDQIDDAMRHTLRIRVSVECACPDGLLERSVIDETIRLSEIIGVPINLRQLPTGDPPPSILTAGKDPTAQIRQWLEAQQAWTVVLSIGTKETAAMDVTLAGEVRKPGLTQGRRDSDDFLGGLAGGSTSDPSPGTLTAEMIDFEVLAPGQPTTTERRVLFDWLEPAARASGVTPSGSSIPTRPLDVAIQTEILPLPAQPSADFVASLAASSALLHQSDLLGALRDPAKASQASSGGQSSISAEFPGHLYALALARHDWSRYSDRLYIAEANILTRHQNFGIDAGGVLREAASFDVVRNAVDVLEGAGIDPVAVRLHQGALDSNAEILLSTFEAPAVNLAELQAMKGAAIRWQLREHATEHRHRRDVSSGHLILEPVDSKNDGWWRIDSKTGTALAITARGWGGTQVLADFARQNEQQIRTAGIIFRFMMAAHCHVSAMRQALGETYQSAAGAAAAGITRAALCQAGAYLGVRGIAVGGAYGNLLSRSGDIFSIAFSLNSYF